MSKSALYVGHVMHARMRPVRHRLRYAMLNLLIDLDELPALNHRLRLFGANRAGLFSFHETDHLDGSATPLRAQIATLLQAAGLDPEGGHIVLLCMPRVLGMAFNPLSVFFCHAACGRLQAILYEVNNTFGQRHSYLIPADANAADTIEQGCAKEFYVSPFLDMSLSYRFRIRPPAETVAIGVSVYEDESPILFAAFTAERRALTDRALVAALARHAFLAVRVVGGIYWEALQLWRKGLKLHKRPALPEKVVTFVATGDHA